MANIFDKFLDSMKLYDDAEDEEDELTEEPVDEEPYEEEDPEPARPRKSLFARRQPREEEPEEEEEEEPVPERPRPARNYNRVVTPMRSSARGMEVNMIRPSSMDDARDICDMLLSGRAVVINLEGVQVDLAQRIIDFSSGACYSIDGNLQKISSYIFIITPSNIELTGEFQSMAGGASVAAR